VGTNWQTTAFQGSLMMRPVFVADVDPFIGLEERGPVPDLVRLVPNPSNTSFRVVPTDGGAVGSMEVLDALGRSVHRSGRSPMEEVSTAHWPDGPYLVRLFDAAGVPLGQGRLIVQH
jgi:hypothetical protein